MAVSSMGELFTSVVDATLIYPDGPARLWDMCCGTHVRVIVDIRERALEDWLIVGNYEQDRDFRRRMHSWLSDIWHDKDALIDRVLEADSRPGV
jgi:hypothetical protein